MYAFKVLDALLDGDDHDAAHAYMEGFADHVPRNACEAREHVAFAAEVASTVAARRTLMSIDSRTIEALVTLRRLEREARQQLDPFDFPLRREERVLRSLIAYMARPVLVRSGDDVG